MIVLLADVNIQGHVARMVARMQGDDWRDFWEDLELSCVTFAEVGLDRADSDATIWRRCQERSLFLVTNNRNDDGPESLEATIRTLNGPDCVPVFTIGDADSLLYGSEYVDRVIDRLFRYLYEKDEIRGNGRLFLP